MRLNIFRECGFLLEVKLFFIIFSLLCWSFFASGCLQRGADDGDLYSNTTTKISDVTSGRNSENFSFANPGLEVEFESFLSSTTVQTRGRVLSDAYLPFLIFEAALWKDGQELEEGVRYLMIDLEPDRDYAFEIFEDLKKVPPSGSGCLLEAYGPRGLLLSESRQLLELDDASQEVPPRGNRVMISPPFSTSSAQRLSFAEMERDSDLDVELEMGQRGSKEEPSNLNQDSLSRKQNKELERDPSLEQAGPSSSKIKSANQGFVGSKSSNKYHRPDCRFAARIKPENRITFATKEEAEDKGYQPCLTCQPG